VERRSANRSARAAKAGGDPKGIGAAKAAKANGAARLLTGASAAAPDHGEVWRNPDLGACACSQLRRTARAASAIYDRYLAPVGLTVTQYAILVNIGRGDRISRTDLADLMGMERTTLTRNLQPLERQRLIKTTTGGDRRERLIHLSPGGLERLEAAYPLWAEAQRFFLAEVGEKGLTQLRHALTTVVSALGAPERV
jgi:DNA-binding MarR family transcriptional regulator